MIAEFPDFLKNYLPGERINSETLHSFDASGRTFCRLTKDLSGLPRGTVFWDGGILHGYQKIKRIIHLEQGIRRYFKGPFYVEEKMDGYNVRVRRIGDEVFAFTRGGFICPFTTDRLPDLLPLGFFDDFPDYTLCGEVVGPENPYNSEAVPYMKEDIAFFAFDIKDPDGKSISLGERYRIYEEKALPFARHWGPFTDSDIEEIKSTLFELDREDREGIVIKSAAEGEEVKYVTLSSCIRDIHSTAHLMTELPAGFYIQRLIRIAAITYEHSLTLDDTAKLSIADALMEPLKDTVGRVASGESIKEFFTVRVNRKETMDALMLHLTKTGVNVHLVSIEREGSRYKGVFYRTFPKGTKELRRKLRGHGFYD
ncbi:MAG: RNA ligase [Nitrospirae bacterium]|nr:RNA ligase [Nitrospirota bacterium]